MTRVLVTGMSGTGKSALLAELADRGHRAVDTDYGDFYETAGGERLWRADKISALLDSAPDDQPGLLFVQGTTRNQGLFYPWSPPTPTGRTRLSWPRSCATSRRWNRCCGRRPPWSW